MHGCPARSSVKWRLLPFGGAGLGEMDSADQQLASRHGPIADVQLLRSWESRIIVGPNGSAILCRPPGLKVPS